MFESFIKFSVIMEMDFHIVLFPVFMDFLKQQFFLFFKILSENQMLLKTLPESILYSLRWNKVKMIQ